MKIGIYNPYLETLGGGEKYMLTAASCLSQKHEVLVFWDKDILREASRKFNLDLSKVKQTKNIFKQAINPVTRYLESKKYDAVFYLSDGSLPLIGTRLYVHFQFPVEWVNRNLSSKAKTMLIRNFIVNSIYTKSYIDQKFKVNSRVIYPPTRFLKEFPAEQGDKKHIILNVGRISVSNGRLFKKQDIMIKAFKKLSAKNKDWELILAVSFKKEDKKIVDELKKSSKGFPIKIVENAELESLEKLYKDSSIYWHAAGFKEDLEKNPEKAEHFGISTVEAMMNGVVPVVFDAGGQKEIVRNQENGFLWKDEKDLLEKTKKLIDYEGLRKKLSQASVNDSKRFSTDNFCEDIVKIFENE
jgi:glycosyltransferase involved in cell wall biosynthesis